MDNIKKLFDKCDNLSDAYNKKHKELTEIFNKYKSLAGKTKEENEKINQIKDLIQETKNQLIDKEEFNKLREEQKKIMEEFNLLENLKPDIESIKKPKKNLIPDRKTNLKQKIKDISNPDHEKYDKNDELYNPKLDYKSEQYDSEYKSLFFIEESESEEIRREPRLVEEEESRETKRTPRLVEEEESRETKRTPRLIEEEESRETKRTPRLIEERESRETKRTPRLIEERESREIKRTPRLVESRETKRTPRLIEERESILGQEKKKIRNRENISDSGIDDSSIYLDSTSLPKTDNTTVSSIENVIDNVNKNKKLKKDLSNILTKNDNENIVNKLPSIHFKPIIKVSPIQMFSDKNCDIITKKSNSRSKKQYQSKNKNNLLSNVNPNINISSNVKSTPNIKSDSRSRTNVDRKKKGNDYKINIPKLTSKKKDIQKKKRTRKKNRKTTRKKNKKKNKSKKKRSYITGVKMDNCYKQKLRMMKNKPKNHKINFV